jgi:hypothetical protein
MQGTSRSQGVPCPSLRGIAEGETPRVRWHRCQARVPSTVPWASIDHIARARVVSGPRLCAISQKSDLRDLTHA